MSRKVFLSFLGTGNYGEVRYSFPNWVSPPTRFVQLAIAEYLSKDGDEIHGYIFLTDQAKKDNWHSTDGKNGLESYMARFASIQPVFDLPIANNESSVWEVFRTVYEQLLPGDKIIFDVTHAFRVVPILVAPLLNFAKFNLNIEVEAVFYGEYKFGESEAPVWDISHLTQLQAWTAGAADFLSFGNTSKLKEAFHNAHAHITFGQENYADTQNLKKALDSIDAFAESVAINHLPAAFDNARLIKGKIEALERALENIPSGYPIALLLDKIKQYYEPLANAGSPFSPEGLNAQAHLMRSLLDASQYVQVITIAREAVISKCMIAIGATSEDVYDEKNHRKKMEVCLGEWAGMQDKSLLSSIQKSIALLWRSITSIRNPVDHAYMKKDRPAVKKSKELIGNAVNEAIQFLKKPISDIKDAFDFPVLNSSDPILLNLTNHPSIHWPQPQAEAANAAYGEVQDLPFPQIDPTWTSEQINQLADQYLHKIQALQPTAVHIMGELTFTFALVNKLQSAGIPCIASTTERTVTTAEDGSKTSTFRFVAFRPY